MPWVEIYRQSMDESAPKLTRAEMQEIIDNYDPEYREAPLVIGHPKDNKAPAWGWVKKLKALSDSILALVEVTDDRIREIMQKGLYKKISMAFANIKGKGLYLWHVGLLGATQPAVAGMTEVSLETPQEIFTRETDVVPGFLLLKAAVPSEIPLADEGTAWSWSWADDADAIIERHGWKGLAAVCAYVNREFETDQKEDGLPAVKGAYKLPFAKIIDGQLKVVWNGVHTAMAAVMGARQEMKISEADRKKAFNTLARQYKRFEKPVPEFKSIEEGGIEMEKVQALEAELKDLKTKMAEAMSEAEEKVKALEAEKEKLQTKHAELSSQVDREREEAWVETQIKEAKILPAWEEAGLVEFLLSLDGQEIEVKSADGKTAKTGQREMFKKLVESQAKLIDFGEVALKEKAAEGDGAEAAAGEVEIGKKETVDPDMAVFDKKVRIHMKAHGGTYEEAVEKLKPQLR